MTHRAQKWLGRGFVPRYELGEQCEDVQQVVPVRSRGNDSG